MQLKESNTEGQNCINWNFQQHGGLQPPLITPQKLWRQVEVRVDKNKRNMKISTPTLFRFCFSYALEWKLYGKDVSTCIYVHVPSLPKQQITVKHFSVKSFKVFGTRELNCYEKLFWLFEEIIIKILWQCPFKPGGLVEQVCFQDFKLLGKWNY